jgi:putative membrane protein
MKTSHKPHCTRPRHLFLWAGALVLSSAVALGQPRPARELPPARDVNPASVPVSDDPDVRDRRDVRVDTVRPLKRVDRGFLEKAARAMMSEIQISQIAASRTSNPDVRRLAQSIIEDHQNALDDLARLAAGKGVSLPARDPHPEKWEKRNARNFDRDYLDQMVDDHEEIVKLFDKQARDGEDVEAVAFARKHLARLQHHLQQSLDMKRVLK